MAGNILFGERLFTVFPKLEPDQQMSQIDFLADNPFSYSSDSYFDEPFSYYELLENRSFIAGEFDVDLIEKIIDSPDHDLFQIDSGATTNIGTTITSSSSSSSYFPSSTSPPLLSCPFSSFSPSSFSPSSFSPSSFTPSLSSFSQPPFVTNDREDSLDEKPYRNIPTVVQDSLSENEEDDEDVEGITSEFRRKSNTASTKYGNIPHTIFNAVNPSTPRRVRRRKDQLWYFLLEILGDPECNPHYIVWENKDQGIFRFIESKKVAQLWGAKKKRAGMSYEYFARAMRHYYSRGIMRRVTGRRLVYQFGPKAENWKTYAQQVAVGHYSNNEISNSSRCNGDSF